MTVPRTVTAFQSSRRIASGPLLAVASAVKSVIDAHDPEPVLIFDDHSSELVDVDFRGTPDEVRDRLARAFPQDQPGARGRGRPKLGVVAREVTLLPRPWDWLGGQAGGAPAGVRRVIDEAGRGGGRATPRGEGAPPR